MADFELDSGEAGTFRLRGDVTFHTAQRILERSEKLFARDGDIEVDLSAVERTDSSGLALLLEWINQACKAGRKIHFSAVPEKIMAIAETAEISELLGETYSCNSSSAESSSANSSSENSSSSKM